MSSTPTITLSGTAKTGEPSRKRKSPVTPLPDFKTPPWKRGEGVIRWHYKRLPAGSRCAWASNWYSASRTLITADSWMNMDKMDKVQLRIECEDIARRASTTQQKAASALAAYTSDGYSPDVLSGFRDAIQHARPNYPAYLSSWDCPSAETLATFHSKPERLGWTVHEIRPGDPGVRAGRSLEEWDAETLARDKENDRRQIARKLASTEAAAEAEKLSAGELASAKDKQLAEAVLRSIDASGLLQKQLFDQVQRYASNYGMWIKSKPSGVARRQKEKQEK